MKIRKYPKMMDMLGVKVRLQRGSSFMISLGGGGGGVQGTCFTY